MSWYFERALAEFVPEPGSRVEVFKRTFYLLPADEQARIEKICMRLCGSIHRLGPVSALEIVGELGLFMVLKERCPDRLEIVRPNGNHKRKSK